MTIADIIAKHDPDGEGAFSLTDVEVEEYLKLLSPEEAEAFRAQFVTVSPRVRTVSLEYFNNLKERDPRTR